MLAGLIDGWKNRGLTPSQVPAGEAAMFGNGKGGKLYASYQERLKILNAADFGDLLLENIRLFREHPDVLRQYQGRFKFILVDEYQDTNVAQYLWLRLLAQAPSKPGVPLSSVIPGLPTSSVIPGRAEGANPESGDEEDSARDSGSAPSAHPGMTFQNAQEKNARGNPNGLRDHQIRGRRADPHHHAEPARQAKRLQRHDAAGADRRLRCRRQGRQCPRHHRNRRGPRLLRRRGPVLRRQYL
jgi:hypothetical protein